MRLSAEDRGSSSGRMNVFLRLGFSFLLLFCAPVSTQGEISILISALRRSSFTDLLTHIISICCVSSALSVNFMCWSARETRCMIDSGQAVYSSVMCVCMCVFRSRMWCWMSSTPRVLCAVWGMQVCVEDVINLYRIRDAVSV